MIQVRNGCITMPDNYVKDHVIIYTRILRSVRAWIEVQVVVHLSETSTYKT